MKSNALPIAMLIASIGATGCVSNSSHHKRVELNKYEQVYVEVMPQDALLCYQSQVEAVLVKHGFQVTTNRGSDVLVCKAGLSSRPTLVVQLSLWDSQRILLSVEAFNAWGIMSRGSLDALVKRAIQAFDNDLGKL